MTTAQRFLSEIEDFLKSSGMSETRFGRDAVGDPSFVFDLRSGREPGTRLLDKVAAYIESQQPKVGGATAEPARAPS